ncbi:MULTISPECIES: GLPGLI family protein [Tenacibaculum]|uniref:GLPGLI family protein n=1 Tax=Tenacibaculum TaxID=104267 RepID=UPI001F0A8541|nr:MULTISPECIES: GLPGLI family protein [Tenacibaculum]MCH3881781.1 GLPGLI family protein [Tenacibaculum aquimarinum]MDO6598651.1 GLPGLI family protein [Tenacibaculum sp. 1_MG-2023]
MKTIIIIIILTISFSINAQDFTGKATYKTYRKSSISFGEGKNAPNPEMQKKLEAQMKKMNQKTFTLNFNRFESTYKENESLAAPQTSVGGLKMISFGGNGTDLLYKNVKENKYAKQTDIMGKNFLIKDEIKKIDWELSDETKNIGMYTCYKATYSREVEQKDFSSFNSVESEGKVAKKMKTIVTTAWYTPQIPISNGPREFGGLPGLILELRQDKLTIVCSEVVLNPSKKIEIKEPKKGKVISQSKFNEIQEKKSKEMMEKFKSRKGLDLGNGTTIKIGG